ncbi:MAG: DUF1501 domain-containing protein [Gemmataceae bacterium]|nr:DUF1501 domain-containing protein [Gemmataceae bacterium]
MVLTVQGSTRRDFLRLSALGGLKGATSSPVRAANFGRARRCLQLFLTGGPSQLDTFDLKPTAPEKIRGEFRPISTSVPGTQISELFP